MKSSLIDMKKKKESIHKTVLISGCLPPPVGGMTIYYQTLINSLSTTDLDFEFVVTSTHMREFSNSGKATLINLSYALEDCYRFSKALFSLKPRISHIGTAFGLSFIKHSYCVFFAHFVGGAKVILHPHCSLAALFSNKPKLWKWFFRQVIKKTDGVIAISKEWMNLPTFIHGTKMFFLPNPVDIEELHIEKNDKQSQQLGKFPIRVLYLGYLGHAKGTFEIIEAAKLLRCSDCQIFIDLVGGELLPGELNSLYDQVELFNLQEIIKINKPAFGEEKLDFLHKADIFIYPSYHEGMPLAVLEAMACELPIIASNVGGLPDLVDDGVNGILIETGKPEQLAQAIIDLSADPELIHSMGKKSYEKVTKEFSISDHITKLENIYKVFY